MSDLRDLYQEVILDHYRKPRNYGSLEESSHQAQGHNPLCGDRIKIYLRIEGDQVRDVGFEGSGCAISTASASLMTEAIKGMDVEQVEAMFRDFQNMVVEPEPSVRSAQLGKLGVLAGVREYPVRIKCATLAWHALGAALAGACEASSELPPSGDKASEKTIEKNQ